MYVFINVNIKTYNVYINVRPDKYEMIYSSAGQPIVLTTFFPLLHTYKSRLKSISRGAAIYSDYPGSVLLIVYKCM